MNIYMKQKITSWFFLWAICDIIGFNNGSFEFFNMHKLNNKKNVHKVSSELIAEFFNQGGFSNFNLSNKLVWDDSIFNIMTIKNLCLYNNDIDIFIKNYKLSFIEEYNKENFNQRYPGICTQKYIQKLNNFSFKNIIYDNYAGGSGCSMKSMSFGIIFHNDNKKLFVFTILSSLLTHPNAFGFLGGLVSALFSSYIINKINIELWPKLLIDLLESTTIDDIILNYTNKNFFNSYIIDKKRYIKYWKLYIKIKHKIILPHKKSIFFAENFSFNNKIIYPGSNGLDSVIIAYDNLLYFGNNFEQMIIYNCLHIGDSDTTGIICGTWFGLLYGKNSINKSIIKQNFEFKSLLDAYANKVYKLFYQ